MDKEKGDQAWVALPLAEQVAEYAAAQGKSPYDFGFVFGMTRLVLAHERIAPAFRALYKEVMFSPGHLSRREREMVAAVATTAQDCFY